MKYAKLLSRSLFAGIAGAVLACPVSASAGEWLRAESGHVVVYTDVDRAGATDFIGKLEAYDRFLSAFHQQSENHPESKLEIYLVAHSEEVGVIWPTRRARGFYAHNGVDVPFLVSTYQRIRPGRAGDPAADDNVFHEYTHHFMLGSFPAAYPGWVVEGYAQYFQTIDFEPGAVVVGGSSPLLLQRASAVRLPWATVIRSRSSGLQESQWNAFYGQAWLLTRYMMSDPARTAAFNRYLTRVSAGDDPLAALLAVLDVDQPELERRLDAFGRVPIATTRYPWRTDNSAAQVTITPMPDSADSLLLENLHGRLGVAADERPAYLEKMRTLAAAWPQDPFALRALASAEVKYGDPEKALTLLADFPQDPLSLEIISRGYLTLAERQADAQKKSDLLAQARGYAAQAYQLDPNNFLVLYTYALARKDEDDYPSDNTLNALIRAHEIYPQVPSVRLELASALILRGRKQEAVNLLLPLANNPHGGSDSARASEIIARVSG